MSIKTLLEKAMLRLGSRGSRNSGNAVSITVDQASSELQPFYAPADGSFEAGMTATSDMGRMWLDDGSNNRWSARSIGARGSMCFSFPVKKGAKALVLFADGTNRTLRFITSVGGAKNLYYQLLNGGALCLRLSSWSMGRLKRVLSGLDQGLRQLNMKQVQHLRSALLFPSSLRQTATLLCVDKQPRITASSRVTNAIRVQVAMGTSAVPFEFEKGKLFWLKELIELAAVLNTLQKLGLSRFSVCNNLTLGGAL